MNKVDTSKLPRQPMQVVEAFLNCLTVEKNVSPRTTESYRVALRRFASYLSSPDRTGPLSGLTALSGKMRFWRGRPSKPWKERWTWADVTRDIVRDFLGFLRQEGYKDTTCAQQVGALRSFYKFLVMEEIVVANPMGDFPIPKRARTLPRTLTIPEMEDLIAAPLVLPRWKKGTYSKRRRRIMAAKERDHAMLELLFATGIRISELVGLDVDDIWLTEENPRIRVMGKGSKERVVPIHDRCRETLVVYVEKYRPRLRQDVGEKALFLTHMGKRGRLTRAGAHLILTHYSKALGLADFTPHKARHTFATLMLDGGAGLLAIKEFLGHESVSTTQIYAHVSVSHLRETYDRCHPRAR